MADVKVTIVDTDGTRHHLQAAEGTSVMELATAKGLDMEGACEGSLACATCHVFVDKQWYNRLPPADEDEDDMLDMAPNLSRYSRLGCQIVLSPELDGLCVTIAGD